MSDKDHETHLYALTDTEADLIARALGVMAGTNNLPYHDAATQTAALAALELPLEVSSGNGVKALIFHAPNESGAACTAAYLNIETAPGISPEHATYVRFVSPWEPVTEDM